MKESTYPDRISNNKLDVNNYFIKVDEISTQNRFTKLFLLFLDKRKNVSRKTINCN